ncbi:SurA N-terminal domain-containing protein [Jannaschia sp. Os4]|uniref:SurA N-terminal domain-containing protein n=1 Tax=Jannaschia sp. Os4 TaxID=2807617 RepID=UPI00193AB809|nr:SurA N-terminal domain-containing protein [Jannaschia sp. Os4]MBM2577039.1 SurA N-terminal domain-containing protein [Jannaschia sp. Os4]
MASQDEERHEKRKKRKASNALVWAILALLILALGGFGIGGFGGTVRSVAEVGDVEVDATTYARALQSEQRRLAQATGGAIGVPEMRALGLDAQVLQRLLAAAALEDEADDLAISVGDAEVARAIRENGAFGGVSGRFDREGYAAVLRQNGLTERQFEARTRSDLASSVLQDAVLGGIRAPDAQAEFFAAWLSESRDATLADVTVSMLEGGPLAPSDDDLATFLEAEADRFRTPERKRLTYAWLDPATVARGMDVSAEDLTAAYEARADEFRRPARVLAERLAFADAEAAAAARAEIEAGESTFDALVEARGLTLEDVDQGELSADDLSDAAAAAVFALTEPGLAGPVETPLGPALFRVNAVLDASETPLAEVEDELRLEIAAERAEREIEGLRDTMDDLLAGGATLEELEAEIGATVATLDWFDGASEGPAGYAALRQAASEVQEGDFPEVIDLDDGGLIAIRLDETLPAELPALDEIRDEVAAVWTAASTRERLEDRARALAGQLRDGATFEELGLTPVPAEDAERATPLPGRAPAVTDALFELSEPGEVAALAGDDLSATIVRLDAIDVPDLGEGEAAALVDTVRAQLTRGYAEDLFEAYGRAVQQGAGVQVNQAAVNAVLSQLGGL